MSNLKNRAFSPTELAKMEREATALDLRRQGGTWAQIARRMREFSAAGEICIPSRYTATSAERDVERAIERWAIDVREDAKIERFVWLERLREIFVGVYSQAKQGDLLAVDRILSIVDHEAKLIPGLYPRPEAANSTSRSMVGVDADNNMGEIAGPVVVTIKWPDVPEEDALGSAEPGDPATDNEVTKMLVGTFGFKVGNRLATLVVAELAVIAQEITAETAGQAQLNHEMPPSSNHLIASEIAAPSGD